jgi:hypothetical protein
MGRQKSAEGIVVAARHDEGPNLLESGVRISDRSEQMPRKRALKLEVVDGIHEVRLGAYRAAGKEATNHTIAGTAVVRNRMPGGVGGRRG